MARVLISMRGLFGGSRKAAAVIVSACLAGAFALCGLNVSAAYYNAREAADNRFAFTPLRTVSFDAAGGTIDAAALDGDVLHDGGARLVRTMGDGACVGTLPTASRDAAHPFAGWFTDPEAGDAITADTTVGADTTYYARWNVLVTFDAAGGRIDAGTAIDGDTLANEGATLTRVRAMGAPVGTLPGVAARDGLVFAGWFTDPEAGDAVAAHTTVADAVTYHARWTRRSVTITFDAGAGTLAPTLPADVADGASRVVRSVEAGALVGTPPAATRSGYVAAGWHTADGTELAAGTRATDDVTYHLRWTIDGEARAIVFDANGGAFVDAFDPGEGTVSGDRGRVEHACRLYAPLSAGIVPTGDDLAWPADDGHVFAGWYTAEVGGHKVGFGSAAHVFRGYTYYAHWNVTVAFDPAGGTFADDGGATTRSASVDAGAFGVGALPTLATRDGLVLDGWYTEEGGRGTRVCAHSRPIPGATYHAHWRDVGDIHYATVTTGSSRNRVTTLYLSSHAITADVVGTSVADHLQARTSGNVGWASADVTRVVVLDGIAPTSCAGWFASGSLTTVEGLANIDMSDVTSLAGMFQGASNLTLTSENLADMGAWNVTSKLGATAQMFAGVGRLNADTGAVLDLSAWDVSGVRSAYRMFYNAYVAGTLDASTWDLSHVDVGATTGTSQMFYASSSTSFAALAAGMRLDMADATFNASETSTFTYGCLSELVLGPGWAGARGDMGASTTTYVAMEPSDVTANGLVTGTRYSVSPYGDRYPLPAWDGAWTDLGVDDVTYRRFSTLAAATSAIDAMKAYAERDAAAFEALAVALPAPSAITTADAAAVEAARAAYDALWARVRLLVSNELVSKLVACEYRLRALDGETVLVVESATSGADDATGMVALAEASDDGGDDESVRDADGPATAATAGADALSDVAALLSHIAPEAA